MDKMLKGGSFVNRYRFTGTLETRSPLHIGSGEKIGQPEVSLVIKDYNGKPLIPGSTLRGVMRHWLLSILTGFGQQWAVDRNYREASLADLSQENQVKQVMTNFSWLELLFGTPFHEGKVEVWDAACQIQQNLQAPDTLLGWNSASLTYTDTSVVINPSTGTAMEDLLYNAEVVPPGVKFEFNLVGQNLSDLEVGLILLALQGFNSSIYPIRIGARNGRGYGQMKYIPGSIYKLKKSDLKAWAEGMLNSYNTDHSPESAGYYALPELPDAEQEKLIQEAKSQVKNQMEASHV